MADKLILGQRIVDMDIGLGLGTAGQPIEPLEEYVLTKIDLYNGARRELLNQSKLTAFSPLSVIQSPLDEDCIASYFLCPILQEPMRDPRVAADGFTYEADAIRGWLDGGRAVSPVAGQPLAHRELLPNFALRAVIQGNMTRRQQDGFS
ncbi:putative U-box domain-containing protein 58 [Phragmites australis]|uniref:putative U-box domain-containing protein 58 n=1 Tax=Phragmites australis TaxID=29695 RepID=UPI002D7854B9|nr:putative U-box domain-containing protein 58 [Phragmites australis]